MILGFTFPFLVASSQGREAGKVELSNEGLKMAKTIFKIHHTKDYTIISNKILEDKNLTWKAKGLMAYLLSRPEDWRVFMKQLEGISKDGKHATRSALQELIDKGYIVKKVLRDKKGKFSAFLYEVYEEPSLKNPFSENQKMDVAHEKKSEFSAFPKGICSEPVPKNPFSEKSICGKSDTTNTEYKLNTELTNININNFDDFKRAKEILLKGMVMVDHKTRTFIQEQAARAERQIKAGKRPEIKI